MLGWRRRLVNDGPSSLSPVDRLSRHGVTGDARLANFTRRWLNFEAFISFVWFLETYPVATPANFPACISVHSKAYSKPRRCSPCFARERARGPCIAKIFRYRRIWQWRRVEDAVKAGCSTL